VAYRVVIIPMTLSDIEGHFCCLRPLYLGKCSMHYLRYHVHSPMATLQAFSNVIFRTTAQQLTRFQLAQCVGPFAKTEFFVKQCNFSLKLKTVSLS